MNHAKSTTSYRIGARSGWSSRFRNHRFGGYIVLQLLSRMSGVLQSLLRRSVPVMLWSAGLRDQGRVTVRTL